MSRNSCTRVAKKARLTNFPRTQLPNLLFIFTTCPEQLTLKVYLEQILKPIVKPWIENHPRFVLEEDGDSGHGTGSKNIVRTWKQENKLEHYFNCASSPDLSPIESMWQVPKQELRKYPHWDDHTTKGLIYEGWSHVSQEYINEKVPTMPERLKAVIEEEGRMTGY